MAQKAIREYDGKRLLEKVWKLYLPDIAYSRRSTLVTSEEELRLVAQDKGNEWLESAKLVVKPDMLFGKRGQNNLVQLNCTLAEAGHWITAHQNQVITLLEGQSGLLTHFLVEEFVPHAADEEFYLSFSTDYEVDKIYFSDRGGVQIEEHWEQVSVLDIPLGIDDILLQDLVQQHLASLNQSTQIVKIVTGLYRLFRDLNFTYLEINPFVLHADQLNLLDLVAKVDDTAEYNMASIWGHLEYPVSFGRPLPSESEKLIQQLDKGSGSSLKLTVFNRKGRIWGLFAGGSGSVVFADSIAEIAGFDQLANYGEYSGNPTTQEMYQYSKAILDLVIQNYAGQRQILLIGGGIANFTDVAATFKGIIQALRELGTELGRIGLLILVRRAGPNYQVGLKQIVAACQDLEIPIQAYGSETDMTAIVAIAYELLQTQD